MPDGGICPDHRSRPDKFAKQLPESQGHTPAGIRHCTNILPEIDDEPAISNVGGTTSRPAFCLSLPDLMQVMDEGLDKLNIGAGKIPSSIIKEYPCK